ncbi:MAG TPA: UDP-glucose/GDP-mannose dehydrogenase family protein [bacterium]|nr:UDP-glucose/GDP-mannose dehydrogenase family protein [bacterium]HPN31252.1 UDP-glucose/GDP-mannose dehydrogenase family protein [bacterium]
MKKVCVIGSGYVGLVAGACISELGASVICVDKDKEKIEKLKNGIIPIYEPGLAELIERNVFEKRLRFSASLKDSIKESEIIFIAVGTPPQEDGSTDLNHILNAAEDIAENLNSYKIIVIKSTVPVGTSELVRKKIKSITDVKFDIISNPEFLKEGDAIKDFMRPDRIVIGASNDKAAETMKSLYSPLVRTGAPILVMDNKSAEVTKYASNAMLATKISFMNEIANFCEKAGADVSLVRAGVGSDSRIGKSFLFPGCGYGGSCFPKDIKALIKTAEEYGVKMKVINSVEEVNEEQKKIIIPKIESVFGADLRKKNIAIWGLAFKARTDDMREAPSIVVINELLKRGANISAYDPEAVSEAKKIFKNKIKYAANQYDAVKNADCLIIITDWNEFRQPDYERLEKSLKQKIIFDGRNLLDVNELKSKKFTYYGVGLRPVIEGK